MHRGTLNKSSSWRLHSRDCLEWSCTGSDLKRTYLPIYDELHGTLPIKLKLLESSFPCNKLLVNPILQEIMLILLDTAQSACLSVICTTHIVGSATAIVARSAACPTCQLHDGAREKHYICTPRSRFTPKSKNIWERATLKNPTPSKVYPSFKARFGHRVLMISTS